tara:strand:- start:238 stop:372 length:135 start_codon:yes stop_codon:yes gene_type:complete
LLLLVVVEVVETLEAEVAVVTETEMAVEKTTMQETVVADNKTLV